MANKVPANIATSLEQVKSETPSIQTIAQAIARAADAEAVPVEYVADDVHLLRQYKIDIDAVAGAMPAVVAEAKKIFRESIEATFKKARLWNKRLAALDSGSVESADAPYGIPGAELEIGHKSTKGKKVTSQDVPVEKKERASVKPVRAEIFGYSVTAVIRYLGAHDWTFEDALTAVENLAGCYKLSEATVKIQLKAGKKGERGPAAPLTAAQEKQLRKACK